MESTSIHLTEWSVCNISWGDLGELLTLQMMGPSNSILMWHMEHHLYSLEWGVREGMFSNRVEILHIKKIQS